MIDSQIKQQAIKTLRVKLQADTGIILDSCIIEFTKEGLINIELDIDGKKSIAPLAGKEKFILNNMFKSKMITSIKEKRFSSTGVKDFKSNESILLQIDFKSNVIQVYTENLNKKGETFNINFNF